MAMNDEDQRFVAEWERLTGTDWAGFWADLTATWRSVLTESGEGQDPSPARILRRERITTDFEFVSFHPVAWFPALTEALLWQDNGMDLTPLRNCKTGQPRSWKLLQIAGPGTVRLSELRGTPVRELILADVSVLDTDMLADLPGLESLTLQTRDRRVTLPPLPGLTTLTVHPGSDVDVDAVRDNPGLRIVRAPDAYLPPFR